MTTPAVIARGVPDHSFLEDGFQITIAFSADTTIALYEKVVTPPGVDGGEPIPLANQLSTTYRTFTSRALKTLTPMQFTCAYATKAYPRLVTLINVEGTITIHWPDGATLSFYGFLQAFQPAPVSEGVNPEASCIIVPTNRDPISKVEVAPSYVIGSGT